MPKRGSRAQLLRDLTRRDATIHSGFYGEFCDPLQFLESYAETGTGRLAELADELNVEPQRVGSPAKGLIEQEADQFAEVDDVLARTDLSQRRACALVSARHGLDDGFRMRYRRSREKR